MNQLKPITAAILTLLVFTAAAVGQGTSKIPNTVTLFKNVQVFDGKQDKLQDMDVLVVKNKIHKIANTLFTHTNAMEPNWAARIRGKTARQIVGLESP